MLKLGVLSPVANHEKVPHGGIYSAGLEYDSKTLDFSSNVNPLGFPAAIKKDLKKSTSLLSIYPDPDSVRLRDALARYVKVPRNQIIVGNGATEIIYNFSKAFLARQKVLIPVPTFGEYDAAARLEGSRVSYFETINLNRDIEKFVREIPGHRCVFVCNPNNPTGILTRKKNILRILEASRKNLALVFLDECFIEMSDTRESLVPSLPAFDNLFILRSLSMSFGLAGLRLGYGLGSKEMIGVLNRIKIPWNVSGIAQSIAIRALSDMLHLERTRRLIARERRFLKTSLSKAKFRCYDSDTNFILIRSEIDSKRLQKKLLENNILVRDCS